ncbi:unnamed protein product [Cladocopium goreaui]|uniref:Retrovirus-related Pol polyprotein from type-1 retrotransposable element R2 n=1 Tax=Cladocopium goreaui TaxID=2562237 RepID=A0A9P1C3R0_9DINO|nr:unnamed protein product [Cladocopium goreaui]
MQANGFVLARKRYWWNNLVSKTPHLADEFLKKAQLARKTVEETLKVGVETESTIRWKKMLTDRANAKSSKPSSSSSVKSSRPKGKKRPVAKVQLKPKARPTKGQLAKNRHGGKRGVRVGEASHPGPTNLKVVTLNTQSSSNTWAFLHQVLTGSDIDVALLQEVSFNPSEAAAFSRYLRKKEFSFYYQKGSPNRRQGNGCSGGVGLLVRKTLPQRFAFADGDQEAQSLFVWVGGVLFGSIYAPPTEESPARAAAMFLDALISCNVQASATWCVGGDFNEVPSHSHFEDVAGAMHGSVCGLGAPTRWDGNREIDFFLVNRPDLASAVSSLALKLSDHKILQMQLAVSVQSPTTASLQKGPDLTKPTHVESEQWREVVEKAWEQTTQDIKGVASPFAECTVQEHWERIQALFRQTYQHAFRQVAVRHSEKKLALKGQNANVKWRSQAARGPRPENGHRKVRRKLARWYELRRFLMRDPSQLTAAQTIEFQNLLKKLDLAETGPPPLREVQARIDAISSLLGQAEKQAKESNIRQWRLRMQNVASLSRWLKSKQNPSHCVVTGTDNVVDGATAIFQFWHDFWRDLDAGRPAFADRVSTALAGIPQDLPALQWNCPNGVQLMATVQGCRGAAGADGWTADEIRYLPLDAFNLVANFFERCVAEGELPSQFFEARMVCIPKGDPLGPLIMSLWVLSGVLSVQSEGSSVSTYLDDRCVTAVSPAILRQSLSRWEAWSAGVGLLESVAKTVAVGRRAAERSLLQSEFQPSMVSCWIRVLGACSYSSPRGLTPVESERVSAALQCLSLLGGVGFNLSHFLTNCRLFALSKVGFGWVARAPPLYASQRLFTAVWKNSRRVRFSNPWLRAMLLGGNVHLDITWITRLVGSLIRGSVRYRPRWSLRPGTVASCLHGWLIDRGWRLVREWVWEHDFAAVALDLFPPRVLPSLLPGLAGVAQHNLRQGWRAWCFQKWANSGRHEVQQLEEATSAIFRNLNFQDIRDWALSNGTASSIALGATCSPANFQVRELAEKKVKRSVQDAPVTESDVAVRDAVGAPGDALGNGSSQAAHLGWN